MIGVRDFDSEKLIDKVEEYLDFIASIKYLDDEGQIH